jgi:peptidoglycan/LPS O-acetylase OafA/YrhL
MAVLLLFLFHPARIFDTGGIGFPPWYITNSEVSRGLTYFMGLINPWHMPLFFLLAGASTCYALQFRSAGRYVRERFVRLLIPFVFGVLVIAPPQMYYMLLDKEPSFAKSFWTSYPQTLVMSVGDAGGHLWFILYLFGFSLVALPLFLFLRGDAGKRMVNWLAAFFSRRGAIFLLAIPIVLMDYALLHTYPNPLLFTAFYILGYILMADARFGGAIERHRFVALLAGPGTYVVWFTLAGGLGLISTPQAVWPYMNIYLRFVGWASLIAILGYGKRFLSFTNAFLRYAGQASYPYYILHQTAIIVVGYYVIQWSMHLALKYLIIVGASFAATAIVYEVLIKRTKVTRFLFGMRLRSK